MGTLVCGTPDNLHTDTDRNPGRTHSEIYILEAKTKTKSLQAAIECLQQFPPDVQNKVARVLLSRLEEEPEPGDLEAIEEARKDFQRGKFVTLEEWRKEIE
jgi:hypothetical protein